MKSETGSMKYEAPFHPSDFRKEETVHFPNVSRIIEEFHILSLMEKEYVADVVTRQLAELRREEIARRATEARANFDKGMVMTGTVQDMFEDLEND